MCPIYLSRFLLVKLSQSGKKACLSRLCPHLGHDSEFRTLNIACLTRSLLMSPLLARFATSVALVDPELLQAMAAAFSRVDIGKNVQKRLNAVECSSH